MNREGCWSGWILRIALESYGVQREAEKVRERERKRTFPREKAAVTFIRYWIRHHGRFYHASARY